MHPKDINDVVVNLPHYLFDPRGLRRVVWVMERKLSAGDVAEAIRAALTGRLTQQQLGDWALQAMLNHDTGAVPFADERKYEIIKVLRRLLILSEGPDYQLDEAELEALSRELDPSERQ